MLYSLIALNNYLKMYQYSNYETANVVIIKEIIFDIYMANSSAEMHQNMLL